MSHIVDVTQGNGALQGIAEPDEQSRVTELEIEVGHLRSALASRDVIGQAKGVLMERFKITADEAFHMLVQVSQKRNVRVAVLAAQLSETGEWVGANPA